MMNPGIDFPSFFCGVIFCMILDVFFSIANYFLQKALLIRQKRKSAKFDRSDV